ncbi:MAG TPA: radical SAM protein, partial [bacterium]|nr:radical SAM protein [bacterium]
MKYVWLVNTYKCNNACNWCYASKTLNKVGDMSIKVLRDAIKIIKDFKIKDFVILGGEPTMSDNFFVLLELCREYELSPRIITNGRLLSDIVFLKKILSYGTNRFCISIQDIDNNLHDEITNKSNSFRETERGIKNAINEGLSVSSSTTISSLNIKRVEKFVKCFSDWGIREIGFNVETPDIHRYHNQVIEFSLKDAIIVMKKIIKEGIINNVDIHFASSLPKCL